MNDDTKRELIAEELLKSIGCDMKKLQLLGQGTYNTVYKGLHPNQVDNPGVVIALKVVSGPNEDIKNEKITSIEMKKLQPMDWEKQKNNLVLLQNLFVVKELKLILIWLNERNIIGNI